MAGFGDTCCQRTSTSSPREERQFTGDDDQVLSLPVFAGRYNPNGYLDWEFEVEHIFGCHDFCEHEKLRIATLSFIGFASIWWDVNYK